MFIFLFNLISPDVNFTSLSSCFACGFSAFHPDSLYKCFSMLVCSLCLHCIKRLQPILAKGCLLWASELSTISKRDSGPLWSCDPLENGSGSGRVEPGPSKLWRTVPAPDVPLGCNPYGAASMYVAASRKYSSFKEEGKSSFSSFFLQPSKGLLVS